MSSPWPPMRRCSATNPKRWPVNLINFDSANWFGIPSYYVQKLFSEHRGDVTLPTTVRSGIEGESSDRRHRRRHLEHGCRFKGRQSHPRRMGKVLFLLTSVRNSASWKTLGGRGGWSVRDGALRQTAEKEFIRAIVSDKSWTDYTRSRSKPARFPGAKVSDSVSRQRRLKIASGGTSVVGKNPARRGTRQKPSMANAGTSKANRWYDIKVEVQRRHGEMLARRQSHSRHQEHATVTSGLFTPAPSRQQERRDHRRSSRR